MSNDTVDAVAPVLGLKTSGGGPPATVVMAGSPTRADGWGSTPRCDPMMVITSISFVVYRGTYNVPVIP